VRQLAVLRNIESLVAALQRHAATSMEMGLNDVSSPVEALVQCILRETESLHLRSINLFKSNFPAVDLVDDIKKVAIQVTVNANSKKCKETADKFIKWGLEQKYGELRIIGFSKASRVKGLPASVLVHGPSKLLDKIKSIGLPQMESLENALRSAFDFSKLTPFTDRDCFLTVLDVLDRDAIRHHTSVEGSFAAQDKALAQIREIIVRGAITGEHIFAKPLSQYSNPYMGILRTVDVEIGLIMAVLNRSRTNSIYSLSGQDKAEIDVSRTHIIQSVNSFCRDQGITRSIRAIY
jgi:hypothetical protein